MSPKYLKKSWYPKNLKNSWYGLIAAIQFLTILPIKRSVPFDPRGMVVWFPVVGIIIGALTAILDLVTMQFFPRHLVAVLDVIFLAVITGGLHLDGLADTADGLFSHRSQKRMLEIMKDSRVGVMGVIALWAGMALKWAALTQLPAPIWLYLVIVPAGARITIIAIMALLPYGRDQGTAKAVFEHDLGWSSFAGALPILVLALLLGASGILLVAALILSSALIIGFYECRMGCVTGDMLGAACEFIEVFLWLFACLKL